MAVADANRVVAEGHFDARDDNQLARCGYAVSLASGTAAIFSGIMIDDRLSSAQLQTEAKLYDSPRSDSYGFTLVSGGQFYERQRLAYYRIIRDAEPFPEGAERPVLLAEL